MTIKNKLKRAGIVLAILLTTSYLQRRYDEKTIPAQIGKVMIDKTYDVEQYIAEHGYKHDSFLNCSPSRLRGPQKDEYYLHKLLVGYAMNVARGCVGRDHISISIENILQDTGILETKIENLNKD